jgi:hypothetical protein
MLFGDATEAGAPSDLLRFALVVVEDASGDDLLTFAAETILSRRTSKVD